MVEPYKPLYTIKEASKVLTTGVTETYRLINSGKLPHILVGSKKIRGSDLEKFIESRPAEKAARNAGYKEDKHDQQTV